jgi:hypothetical protein
MDETLATHWGDADFSGSYSIDHELDAQHWRIALERIGD